VGRISMLPPDRGRSPSAARGQAEVVRNIPAYSPRRPAANRDGSRSVGARTVPVRSTSARWGGLQKVCAFVPGHALRTGTVRGPLGTVPRCARWSADGQAQCCDCTTPSLQYSTTPMFL